MAASVIGSQTELATGQYAVIGKSISSKRWFGSYAIRYNLKSRSMEVPWVKFKKCGPQERLLVELKRKDRLVVNNRAVYSHPEVLIPPFVELDQYLLEYKNGFAPPEHDIYRPVRIGN